MEVTKITDYRIVIAIENTTDAEALAALEWLKDNYGSTIPHANFDSTSKNINGSMISSSFTESVSLIQALKGQFSDRLIKYDLRVNE